MRTRLLLLAFWVVSTVGLAQEKMTKADKLFYSYAYANAIEAYQKQMRDGKLMTNSQFLNLADSYFHTGDYKNASKLYLQVNSKDTIMSVHQFNKMLQSMAKNSEKDRLNAFLDTKKERLPIELLENMDFNSELLRAESESDKDFQIFNLGINSPQADFSPSFYKDRLLFSSSRLQKSKKIYEPSGDSFLDIYVGRVGSNGDVLNANTFTTIPDSKYHKATPYYSESLDRFFYILSNTEDDRLAFDENGKNSLALGMVYPNGFFRFLLKDLSTSFYYPFFQDSTNRIYFAANFEDSLGGTDIYYVNTNNGQIMSEPFNLGPRVNTAGNEIAPYVFEGSLYFSSDVFYGLGGMDIYKSNIQPDGIFTIPVNLGSSINSPSDDFGFIIEENVFGGYSGYFSSNRKGGKGGDDIYGFKINRVPGLKTLILRGSVAEIGQGQKIEKASVKILGGSEDLIKEVYTDEDGMFQVELPWRDAIYLEVGKERYSKFRYRYEENKLEEIQKTPLDIELLFLENIVEKKEGKTVLKLNDFLFAKGMSDLSMDMMAELDKVAQIVQEFPRMRFRIESHTDSRGSKYANKKLSTQRAEAVQSYLLQKGVPGANILSVEGFGEEKILNNCTDGVYCLDFLHNQNLRTLIVIENYSELE
ncbi:OmpA family protein [Ulvibacterium marinum]|uniref:OmpA family protein n=1 Tax=Ulvibacterium marinum TaxID=2419782 RepID=A0A3B0C5X1_9FLAO|nr:OmpA family protein [Ulvibacterium marinum]RKN79554.1 OmpA family protein [Ulvibacterium marinum]